jgi:hypothetical protein
MLIDAFRLTASTHFQTVENIIGHFSTAPGGWNHLRCLRSIKHALDGVRDKAALIAGCKGKGAPHELDNAKIVESVLPYVVGRNVQSFPFKRRNYVVTPNMQCSMGPSLFIVEGGVIKLLYVHARNENRASLTHLAGLASLFKSEILDQDFYGNPADVEFHYVDKRAENRTDQVLTLADLQSYLLEPPLETLQRFAVAMLEVSENDMVEPKKRPHSKAKAALEGQEDLIF